MNHELIPVQESENALLMPPGPGKDTKNRLGTYIDWLDATGRAWYQPDLAVYRDYLLYERLGPQGQPATLAPVSVSAHLSTIRGRYQMLLKRHGTRDFFYRLAPAGASPADRKALVDELVTRIKNAIDPSMSEVKLTISQDKADSAGLRLTAEQAGALMAAPGVATLKGLRDTAIIALALCTGAREAELAALEVGDLRQELGGALALHIRKGKGMKERLVPYGALEWVLVIVDRWLSVTGIREARVFRSVNRHGKVDGESITTRSIRRMFAIYPIVIQGKLTIVHAHDCRRTYARRLYEAGMDLVSIQQNLGHADVKTTLNYIGELDVAARKPPAMYTFDLAVLNNTN